LGNLRDPLAMAGDPERSDSAVAADLGERGRTFESAARILSAGEGVFPRRRAGALRFFAVVHHAFPRLIYQS
jgi:hypothetical protein